MLIDLDFGFMVADILQNLLSKYEDLQQIFAQKGLKALYKELGNHPEDYGLMKAESWIGTNAINLFKMLGLLPYQIGETVVGWIHEELPAVNGDNFWQHDKQIKAVILSKIEAIPKGHLDDPSDFFRSLCHLYGAKKRNDNDDSDHPVYTIEDISDLYEQRLIQIANLGEKL